MATFYVLPPRACLDDQLTTHLGKLLPGLPLPVDLWEAVADRLASISGWPTDVYLVPRDDLAPGEPVGDSLLECFGAEPGDTIIEVNANGSRSWIIPGMSVPALAR